jgi:hypothetical protein
LLAFLKRGLQSGFPLSDAAFLVRAVEEPNVVPVNPAAPCDGERLSVAWFEERLLLKSVVGRF